MDNYIFDDLENALKPHIMKQFFMGYVLRELQQHTEAMEIFDSLELGVGYRRNDYQMRTDTDTVSEVGFDSFFRGTFLELATRF